MHFEKFAVRCVCLFWTQRIGWGTRPELAATGKSIQLRPERLAVTAQVSHACQLSSFCEYHPLNWQRLQWGNRRLMILQWRASHADERAMPQKHKCNLRGGSEFSCTCMLTLYSPLTLVQQRQTRVQWCPPLHGRELSPGHPRDRRIY